MNAYKLATAAERIKGMRGVRSIAGQDTLANLSRELHGGVRKAETASRLRASGEPVATRILRT